MYPTVKMSHEFKRFLPLVVRLYSVSSQLPLRMSTENLLWQYVARAIDEY